MEIHTAMRVTAIQGTERVESVEYLEGDKKGTLPVDGVLVHIGLLPDTEYLPGNIPLAQNGQVVVNERMETEIPLLLAAGDIRSGSPGQVSTAVGDGVTAAMSAIRQLQLQEKEA